MTTHNCGGRKKNKNYKNNKKKSGVRVGGGIDDVLDGDSEEARHSKSLYIAALYIFHMSGKLIYMIRRKKNFFDDCVLYCVQFCFFVNAFFDENSTIIRGCPGNCHVS